MATKIRLLLAPIAVVLLLSACTVSVFIGSLTDKNVTTSDFTQADLTTATPVDSATLASGDQRVYAVTVGSTALPALYVYLDVGLEVYVYDSNGSIVATSSSRAFFGANYGGIASTASQGSLAPSAITTSLACPGSCVILNSDFGDPFYVRVLNSTSSSVSFDLFAITRDFEDTSEATAGEDPIDSSAFFQGALETLGDVDVFETQEAGTLYLDGAETAGILFEAEISDPFNPGKAPRTIRSGESESVSSFEQVRVYAVNSPDRAAAAGNSSYFLELVP